MKNRMEFDYIPESSISDLDIKWLEGLDITVGFPHARDAIRWFGHFHHGLATILVHLSIHKGSFVFCVDC